ncbi:MAG: hypothetical protein ABI646_05635, partial [Acidobacteriota bacterium]
MKRCPECGREYDNSMMFCLDDGAELLYGPSSMDEPATAILPEPHAEAGSFARPTNEAELRTAILQPPATAGSSDVSAAASRSFDRRILAAPFLLAIVVLGGFFGYRYFASVSDEKINSIAVLPFENRSGTADSDYLSDGLAD